MVVVSGLDADMGLAEYLSIPKKILFMLTNLPYWMVFALLFVEWLRLVWFTMVVTEMDISHVTHHVAYRAFKYAHFSGVVHPLVSLFLHSMLSFGVALSSTLMHLSQIRSGSWFSCCCSCCCHQCAPKNCSSIDILHEEVLSTSNVVNQQHDPKLLVDAFHHRRMQKRLKILDIFCALLASFIFYTQHIDIWIDHVWIEIILSTMCFFGGIVFKRLKWFDLYAITHGLWHILTGNIIYKVLLG